MTSKHIYRVLFGVDLVLVQTAVVILALDVFAGYHYRVANLIVVGAIACAGTLHLLDPSVRGRFLRSHYLHPQNRS